MKKFSGFVKKEFLHIFRDPRTLVVMFGIPVVQVLLFGYVITNEIRDVKVAVLDLSHDHHTANIINRLASSGYFTVEEHISSYAAIDETFRAGQIRQVIVFEPGFGRNLERDGRASIRLTADASDPNTANIVVSYTKAIVQDYARSIHGGRQLPISVVASTRMLYNPELKGAYMFIPGILTLILMLISAMITSISLAREKELGTMEVLLASPLNPLQIIIGKLAPYFLLSVVNATFIVGLGIVVFGIPVEGSYLLLAAECTLFILVALSLGIFISTISKTQQVAMMVSQVGLMLPTILLSGFIFPIDNMPYILQLISNAMPPKWFIIIIKNIMLKGASFQYVWEETLVLAGMLVVLIAISLKKFKITIG